MLSTKTSVATARNAVATARNAVANRFQHLYAKTATIGPGDWTTFKGDTLVAAWDAKKKQIEISHSVDGDGKTPIKGAACTINIPPMLVGGVVSLEGNAFSRSAPDAPKKWVISRAKAKWRLKFSPGVVPPALAKKWESAWPRESTPVSLEQVHSEFVAELVAAQKKILKDAFRTPDTGLAPFRAAALDEGRKAVKAQPKYAAMTDDEFNDQLTIDPELKKQVMKLATEHFVNKGTLQGVKVVQSDGRTFEPRFIVQSAVYKVDNYENGYNIDAKGPTDTELPSTLENMPEAIRRMAMLDGGRDARSYQALQFCNAGVASSSPGYLLPRPTTEIEGKTHPDYAWDPINKSPKGQDVRSWVTITMAPRIVASTDNKYSVQFILMSKRQVAIFHQEKVVSEPASHFATGIGSGLYQDSDDEGDEEEEEAQRDAVSAREEEEVADEQSTEQPNKRQRVTQEPEVGVKDDFDMDGMFD